MQRRQFLQFSLGALAAAAVNLESVNLDAQAARHTRRILYVLGQFSQTTPQQMRSVLDTLGPSSFNVLILSFLQAGLANGKLTLSYNGDAFSTFLPQAPRGLARLRSGFGARKRILLSIGGWQHLPTFAAIRSFGVPAFVLQLTREIIEPLRLDGIDLDLEPQTGGLDQWFAVHRDYGKTLAELTNEYKRLHPTHVVTHAPISAVAAQLYARPTPLPGLPGGLLHATRSATGNNLDWLNIQLYEGGLVPGGDIATFYRSSLVQPLQRIAQACGIQVPLLGILVPLFEPQVGQNLGFLRQTLHQIDQKCADLRAGKITGAALWDYRQVAPSMATWSPGLEAALR